MLETGLILGRGDSDNYLIVITTYMSPIIRVFTNNNWFPHTLVSQLFCSSCRGVNWGISWSDFFSPGVLESHISRIRQKHSNTQFPCQNMKFHRSYDFPIGIRSRRFIERITSFWDISCQNWSLNQAGHVRIARWPDRGIKNCMI